MKSWRASKSGHECRLYEERDERKPLSPPPQLRISPISDLQPFPHLNFNHPFGSISFQPSQVYIQSIIKVSTAPIPTTDYIPLFQTIIAPTNQQMQTARQSLQLQKQTFMVSRYVIDPVHIHYSFQTHCFPPNLLLPSSLTDPLSLLLLPLSQTQNHHSSSLSPVKLQSRSVPFLP